MKEKTFAKRLIHWYTERKRDLPWRRTKDPYPVWLSEIILQQTRVDQGWPYWERFIETFPTIKDLADAPEESVLRLWQGLGYYSRARNLHATAKHVTYKLGSFPAAYDEILKLKGVGPYTAAAIASICFDEPRPVVDGNVFRFVSRFFGLQDDISKSGTRKVFETLLSKEISHENPGEFNQAMMEFGATVCAPKPQCETCLFQNNCFAFAKQLQKSLPIKSAKVKVRNRHFHYVVFKNHTQFFLSARKEKDVWTGLFDFYLLEGAYNEEDVLSEIQQKFDLVELTLEDVSGEFKHILSHQKIFAKFYQIKIGDAEATQLLKKSELESYSIEEVLDLPKPKLIVNYLDYLGVN
ncbi:MAG: A/G-specific adenine glycosylase [Bacteroidota bacterium]